LAFEVLREELAQLEADLGALRDIIDEGERQARVDDVCLALQRYLKLEEEILFPVMRRAAVSSGPAAESHGRLRVSAAGLVTRANDETIADVLAALGAHRAEMENRTLPRASQEMPEELPGLAHELQEAKRRMQGAYGV
jgi:hypothetical protein